LRLANRESYSPEDAQAVSEQIRKILGSKESASHFRISTQALEFNLFARDEAELQERIRLLEEHGHKILSTKILDTPQYPFVQARQQTGATTPSTQNGSWDRNNDLAALCAS